MTNELNRDESVSDKADAAFRQAAVKVVERARQTGTPVVLWEDDQVKEVSPDLTPLKEATAASERLTEGI